MQTQIELCPAALTTSADPNVSSRYDFVPTIDIVNKLSERGYRVFSSKQSGKSPFAAHQVNLAPDVPVKVGDSFVMLSIFNSHNRKTRLTICGGLYRLVCGNGLTYSIHESTHVQHIHLFNKNFNLDSALQTALAQCDKLTTMQQLASRRMLNDSERRELVYNALMAKHNGDYTMPDFKKINDFLKVRRNEDAANDAWSVMNRVQENIFRGVGNNRGIHNIFSQRAVNNALIETTLALVS